MVETDFYDEHYSRWKAWARPPEHDRLARGFVGELRGIELAKGASVLEIGFGQGAFLDWARANAFTVVGVELNSELVDSARGRGHEVYYGHAQDVLDEARAPFDLIVLFDVLEHLTVEDILDLLSFLKGRLLPEGRIVARFPNGGSPFGQFYQHGDVTHRTVLSAPSLEQLALRCGLTVVAARNAAREDGGGPVWQPRNWWVTRKAAYFVRTIFELAIGLVYFGRVIPLDPNLTAVLAHDSQRRLRNDGANADRGGTRRQLSRSAGKRAPRTVRSERAIIH